jgi:hypothetical protein
MFRLLTKGVGLCAAVSAALFAVPGCAQPLATGRAISQCGTRRLGDSQILGYLFQNRGRGRDAAPGYLVAYFDCGCAVRCTLGGDRATEVVRLSGDEYDRLRSELQSLALLDIPEAWYAPLSGLCLEIGIWRGGRFYRYAWTGTDDYLPSSAPEAFVAAWREAVAALQWHDRAETATIADGEHLREMVFGRLRAP